MLDSLGGPDLLAASRPASAYDLGSSPLEIVGGGVSALRKIESLVRNDDRLRIEAGQDLSQFLP
jgi:siroheme synthase (precorrin-2 oxidase/ferrochelatase)